MRYKYIFAVLFSALLYLCCAAASIPNAAFQPLTEQNEEAVIAPQSDTPQAQDIVPLIYDIGKGLIAETPALSDMSDVVSKMIAVQPLQQLPELPTGCEVVSLTAVLHHLGYDIDKLTLARDYLPKLPFHRSGGKLYGADFTTTFAGDPESDHGYGCYAPCITQTANSYLAHIGSADMAVDITGAALEELLRYYICRDIPVIVWITSDGLHEPKLTDSWLTPDGEEVQWLAYEHCVVLIGFDREHGLIFVADPQRYITAYDIELFELRYNDMGGQAVYIDRSGAAK